MQFLFALGSSISSTSGRFSTITTRKPSGFFTGLFTPYDPNDASTIVAKKQTFEEVIPEVTLRWETTDNLTLYAAYKEGFKSGSITARRQPAHFVRSLLLRVR